jgi:hypothetical protein
LTGSIVALWERFWFRTIPPQIYAVLRIALGLVGTGTLLGLSDITTHWDPAGLVPTGGASAIKAWVLARDAGMVAGVALWAGCLVAFVAMTAGIRTAFTVPMAFVSLILQLRWNPQPLSGAHQAMQGFLFCLMWANSGSVWSVDAWLARRRSAASPAAAPVSIAPLRLIRYQVALVYLASGLWKLYNPFWRDGSAVYYVLQNNVFRRFPAVPGVEAFAPVATYTTLFWEVAFAPLLLYRRTRVIALTVGVLIHLGMFALLEIGPFHLVMLASYLAFLDPGTVARHGARSSPQRPAEATAFQGQ